MYVQRIDKAVEEWWASCKSKVNTTSQLNVAESVSYHVAKCKTNSRNYIPQILYVFSRVKSKPKDLRMWLTALLLCYFSLSAVVLNCFLCNYLMNLLTSPKKYILWKIWEKWCCAQQTRPAFLFVHGCCRFVRYIKSRFKSSHVWFGFAQHYYRAVVVANSAVRFVGFCRPVMEWKGQRLSCSVPMTHGVGMCRLTQAALTSSPPMCSLPSVRDKVSYIIYCYSLFLTREGCEYLCLSVCYVRSICCRDRLLIAGGLWQAIGPTQASQWRVQVWPIDYQV